ncbi:hypothetical protein WA026_010031 [Henosepilachna vigintioctopunctata]|uniref:Uncharacterized protein n=1 Tax=Henosepilachna vigintioctopunctata TaxID=420089 RepID=A0AAW1UJB7_9CUCU
MKKRKRKAKGLLAKKLKRDYLRRELEYGRLTMTRCIQNWKDMLTIISNKYLAEELLSCWHLFERGIDYKDLQISLLMDWLGDELEHHGMAFSYHTRLIDHLIDFFQRTFKSIYDDLASKVNEMIFEWTNINNEMFFRCQENERYIETMIYQMLELTKSEEYEEEAKRFSLIDECRATSETLLNNLKAIMQNKVEKLYQNVLKFTKEYENKTQKKMKLYQLMLTQHKVQEKEIATNVDKIFTRKKLIQNLTEKFEKISEMKDKHVNDVTMERDKLNEYFLTLRLKLFNDKKNDVDKRCILVSHSNEAFDYLEAKARGGTKMIKCLSSCRKYETFQEKLCPYPKGTAQFEVKTSENFQKYDLFWYKIANVNDSS